MIGDMLRNVNIKKSLRKEDDMQEPAMQEPIDAEEMQQPIKVDRKNRKIPVSPDMADLCFTCGTCASGCPATGLVPGWDPRKAIRAIALELEEEWE